VLAELVVGRGFITDRKPTEVVRHGRLLAETGWIDAVSITDNAGGHAMLSPDTMATDLLARGQEVIVHVTCKDANRNALVGRGWKLASEGLRNVLCLTGDYPIGGYGGQASPVFDMDSVALLEMYAGMHPTEPDETGDSRLFLGAVVNNDKRHEREVMPQYLKLWAKIRAGAGFVVTQVGYNARKHDELVRFLSSEGLDVPLIGNVFVLTAGVARAFNAGRIPGCTVTDELLAEVEREARSPDKGRAFLVDLAARQVALFRAFGYRGVYLGGHVAPDDYGRILDLAETYAATPPGELAGRQLRGRPDEFHLFEADPATGLSSDRVSAAYLATTTDRARRAARRGVSIAYRANRAVHALAFAPGSRGFRLGTGFYGGVERSLPVLSAPLHAIEHMGKAALFDCRDCGDCSLPDIAYLCPESQCAKNQRNGPCGGTRDGRCEVGEKQCIWALAYDRLKPYGEELAMLDQPPVLKDAGLRGTSAWANTYLGRDHAGRPRRAAG
jgi:methylenetetrahydrofolate reductase (NADPH)